MPREKKMSDEEFREMIRTRTLISLAKSLREFGYPQARDTNVLVDPVYALACKSNLEDAIEKTANDPTVQSELKKILEEVKEVGKKFKDRK